MSEIETKTVITYGADYWHVRKNPAPIKGAPLEFWSPLVWDVDTSEERNSLVAQAFFGGEKVRVRTWTRESTHMTTYDE